MKILFLILISLTLSLSLSKPITYPNEIFKEGNTTIFSIQYTIWGGRYIIGLGKNGQIYQNYEQFEKNTPFIWSGWNQLTMYCPSANNTQRLCNFDTDPVLAKNNDGRLEVFARFHDNLDLWQMYMSDPYDVTSWTAPREPSCVDQDQKTGLWWCLCPTGGFKNMCAYPAKSYWNNQPVFPTSDLSTLINTTDNRLQLYFRGFAGHYWMVQQAVPGDSSFYLPPVQVTDILFE